MSDSLSPHGLQHTRLPCPSPSPGACSNSCLLSRWCHPTISYSVDPFSSCLQSFPASVQFSLVSQSCPTLCDPMNCSMPGLSGHHQLSEFTQTHVHRVGDAIQPSHSLFSLSSPAFSLSHIRVFSSELALHIRWLEYCSFNISPSNEYSGLITSRTD